MALSLKELRNLSDKEFEKKYDEIAKHTSSGLNTFSLDLIRRENKRSNTIMIICTVAITIMTAVILWATLISANIINVR